MADSGELRDRLTTAAPAVALGSAFVAVMSLLLTEGWAADFLLDRNSTVFPYPFTIQNVMWVLFFGAVGEVWVRFQRSSLERVQLRKKLLPEDEETMLRIQDMGSIRARCRGEERFFVQRLVSRCVLQFQSSKSTERANALLDSSLNLMQHEVDNKYAIVRYLVWVIPTIGFIGTVVGIAAALNSAGRRTTTRTPRSSEN